MTQLIVLDSIYSIFYGSVFRFLVVYRFVIEGRDFVVCKKLQKSVEIVDLCAYRVNLTCQAHV